MSAPDIPLALVLNQEDIFKLEFYQKAYQHMLETQPPKRGYKKAKIAYEDAAKDFALWMEVRLYHLRKTSSNDLEDE